MRTIKMSKLIPLLITLILTNAWSKSFEIDTLRFNGDIDKHINIVILGDGYLASELVNFSKDANNLNDVLFETAPFSNYSAHFNVFAIKTPSNVSGAALSENNLIDNYYGSTFGYYGIDRLLAATKSNVAKTVLADNFPQYDQAILIVNSSKYGGSGGWLATSSTNTNASEIILHEVGHSFAALADEYWAGAVYAREKPNLTQRTDLNNLVWKNWHGDNDIGLYPHSEAPSWYRPHQNCKMRVLDNPFCSVCTEAIVEKIHTLSPALLSYSPQQTNLSNSTNSFTFTLDLIESTPQNLEITWWLNDVKYDSNKTSITIGSEIIETGFYNLSAIIEDTTELVRTDNHQSIHISKVDWEIDQTTSSKFNIKSKASHLDIKFSHNPNHETLSFTTHDIEASSFKIQILNAKGESVKTFYSSNKAQDIFDISQLTKGPYLIYIYESDKFISSKSLIISR